MGGPGSLIDQIQEISQDAVRFARHDLNAELDFSPESLELVEAQLDILAKRLPKWSPWLYVYLTLRPKEFYRPVLMWGAYVGEVIRCHWGGEWRKEESGLPENHSPFDGFVLGLEDGDIRPMSKVWKRLLNGPEDDIRTYYQVLAYMFEHKNLPEDDSVIVR